MKIAILLHGLVGTLQHNHEKHKLINSNIDYDTKKDSNVVLEKSKSVSLKLMNRWEDFPFHKGSRFFS